MRRTWALAPLLGMILVGAALAAGVARAATIDATVTVPLAAQAGDGGRQAAREQALGRIVQRLTGDAARAPAAIAGRVDDYITASALRSEAGGQALTLTFDVPALRESLRRQGVRVWLRERPAVVIWAGVQDGGRSLAGADDPRATALRDAARDYGVPVLLPLLDLTDRQAVTYQDIAGGFSGRVGEATRRYGTSLALAVALQARSGGWNGAWMLVRDGSTLASGRTSGDDAAAVADAVWARAVAQLRPDYTVASGESSAIRVTVTGVNGVAALAAAERALGDSAGVVAVQLSGIEGDRAVFRVEAEVGEDRLRAALDRSSLWAPASPDGGGAEAGLTYRWNARGSGG
ncbi:DUF2066 domain-containing protein [Arhodomonas aquaeolei]|uniref:DUF2066 domain-containing protein n=1 Tax=Arhodomonas aquaeolei TaxID=2369 RepID=UPI00216A4252|nr:DUF2066 domain-containing protein [Arhodomonas aquaeolei]MCS4503598.1 DUF2066 domain-containing protein [Arhodomonas aquaeolei]